MTGPRADSHAEGGTLGGGRYVLGEILGEGGMATVFRARDTRLGVTRAIKLLTPGLTGKRRIEQRFENEARAMASLAHPAIVRVIDIAESYGAQWRPEDEVEEKWEPTDPRVLYAGLTALSMENAVDKAEKEFLRLFPIRGEVVEIVDKKTVRISVGSKLGVRAKTKFEVLDICNPLNIPVGPILSMKELAEEPSLRETGTIVEVEHPERGTYLTVGNPVKLSDSPSDVVRSPLLGEHTDEILREVVGLSDNDIAAARDEGAI